MVLFLVHTQDEILWNSALSLSLKGILYEARYGWNFVRIPVDYWMILVDICSCRNWKTSKSRVHWRLRIETVWQIDFELKLLKVLVGNIDRKRFSTSNKLLLGLCDFPCKMHLSVLLRTHKPRLTKNTYCSCIWSFSYYFRDVQMSFDPKGFHRSKSTSIRLLDHNEHNLGHPERWSWLAVHKFRNRLSTARIRFSFGVKLQLLGNAGSENSLV
jgi:hypothetical protein